MRILITGSSGLVGTRLQPDLRSLGHEVLRMVRSAPRDASEVRWDIDAGTIDAAGLEGLDAVINLAGENVAEGRWTAEKKRRIHDSRVKGTRLLCDELAKLAPPPGVLISASATGIYGDRGDEAVDETSAPGTGFLADVCKEWEAGTRPVVDLGIRVVNLRIGVVLDHNGGALTKLLPPFRLGLGGRIGSGRQYMSWITLGDLVRIITTALTNSSYAGPMNAVAPNPVTNAEFTHAIGEKLGRPSFMAVPAFIVKLLFGEMGKETILSSTRAVPQRLTELGFQFEYPTLDGALDMLLKE